MKWETLLNNMVKKAGVLGMKSVESALSNLQSQADSPWKHTILEMLGDAVDKYGWEGVVKMQEAIDDIIDGRNPDLSFASLTARSDALAFMQNAEADEKSKTKDFFLVVGEALGVLLKAVLQGLMR